MKRSAVTAPQIRHASLSAATRGRSVLSLKAGVVKHVVDGEDGQLHPALAQLARGFLRRFELLCLRAYFGAKACEEVLTSGHRQDPDKFDGGEMQSGGDRRQRFFVDLKFWRHSASPIRAAPP